MTTPHTPQGPAWSQPSGQPPQAEPGFFAWLRRLGIVRVAGDRWIGGVASGLARRFGIDPLIVRGIFFVSIFLGGLGLILYALAWALLPEESDGRIHFQEMLAGRFDSALIGAAVMFVIGVARPDTWGFAPWGWISGLTWVAALVILIILAVKGFKDHKDTMTTDNNSPQDSGLWAAGGDPQAGTGPAPAMPTGTPAEATTPMPATSGPIPSMDDQPTMQTDGPTVTDATEPADAQPAPTIPMAAATAAATATPTYRVQQPTPTYSWGGPGSGQRPPSPPQPPRPQHPARPPREVHRGPDGTWIGVTLGIGLLVTAALIIANYLGVLPIPLAGAITGSGLIIIGLSIVFSGIRGRSSGLLTLFAILLFFFGGGWTAISTYALDDIDYADYEYVGTSDWKPTTVSDAEGGLKSAVGTVTVDLREVPLTGDETVEVPVKTLAGQVTIIVPDDANTSVDLKLRAGNVNIPSDWNKTVINERRRGAEANYKNYDSSETADLSIELDARFGNVTIEER